MSAPLASTGYKQLPSTQWQEGRSIVANSKTELAKLAGEIGWYQEEARKTVMLALQYKLEIGRRLARAKTLLPHGKFLSWAHDEFGWTPRHVQRHLVLAGNASRVSCLPPEMSLRMALAAIRVLRTDTDTQKAPSEAESPFHSQPIHIVGELEPGSIDRDLLLVEITKIAKELGVQKMRWKIR
jgi:hypothetical protein